MVGQLAFLQTWRKEMMSAFMQQAVILNFG
jgi:hypothetical protein